MVGPNDVRSGVLQKGGVAVVSALLFVTCLVAAQDNTAPADLRGTVQGLVDQLDDPTLAKRQAAEQALVALGPDALPLLPAITRRTSAEAKSRLVRIREALEKASAERAARASLVTLRGEMPLSQALAELQKQTGNKIVDFRGKFGQQQTDPPVKADFDKTPFWAALDRLLDQAGLTLYSYAGQEGCVAFVARENADRERTRRACYSGLFRFEGVRLVATRDLRNPSQRALHLTMEVTWEPRVAPIVLQVPLAEMRATDEAGKPLPVEGRESNLEVPVENSIPAAELQVPLTLPPRSVARIASLTGKLSALVPGQIETFEFGDLENPKGTQQQKAGVTATLETVRKNGDVYEVRLRVKFDQAENALESHRNWVYRNEAYLLDAAGKRADNAGLQATRQDENEVGVAYLFDVESLKGCKFVYKTPALIVKLPVTYELKDIELP
jgi:hypothetical protein